MLAAGRPDQGMNTNMATGPPRNGNRRDFVLPVRLRRATVKREQRTAATAYPTAPQFCDIRRNPASAVINSSLQKRVLLLEDALG